MQEASLHINCTVPGWDWVNALHSRLHDAVFWICDQNCLVAHWWFRCCWTQLQGILRFSSRLGVDKSMRGSRARTADPKWSEGIFHSIVLGAQRGLHPVRSDSQLGGTAAGDCRSSEALIRMRCFAQRREPGSWHVWNECTAEIRVGQECTGRRERRWMHQQTVRQEVIGIEMTNVIQLSRYFGM